MTPSWDSGENAASYADFCRRFPKYEETSNDLVELLPVATSGLVVDLACGTGTTTEVILRGLPARGRVVAIDASKAMLDLASKSVRDPRVTWIRAKAEELPDHLAQPADVVLCNSAFWQMDMPAVLSAVRRVLRPGGKFAFNIGREFMVLPLADDERDPPAPNLFQLMQAAAVLYHGFVPPMLRQRGRGGPLTLDSVQSMLKGAGFNLHEAKIVGHIESAESQRAWLSIPIFTERHFGSLPYEERMEALGTAYERLDNRRLSTIRWAVFVAGIPNPPLRDRRARTAPEPLRRNPRGVMQPASLLSGDAIGDPVRRRSLCGRCSVARGLKPPAGDPKRCHAGE